MKKEATSLQTIIAIYRIEQGVRSWARSLRLCSIRGNSKNNNASETTVTKLDHFFAKWVVRDKNISGDLTKFHDCCMGRWMKGEQLSALEAMAVNNVYLFQANARLDCGAYLMSLFTSDILQDVEDDLRMFYYWNTLSHACAEFVCR